MEDDDDDDVYASARARSGGRDSDAREDEDDLDLFNEADAHQGGGGGAGGNGDYFEFEERNDPHHFYDQSMQQLQHPNNMMSLQEANNAAANSWSRTQKMITMHTSPTTFSTTTPAASTAKALTASATTTANKRLERHIYQLLKESEVHLRCKQAERGIAASTVVTTTSRSPTPTRSGGRIKLDPLPPQTNSSNNNKNPNDPRTGAMSPDSFSRTDPTAWEDLPDRIDACTPDPNVHSSCMESGEMDSIHTNIFVGTPVSLSRIQDEEARGFRQLMQIPNTTDAATSHPHDVSLSRNANNNNTTVFTNEDEDDDLLLLSLLEHYAREGEGDAPRPPAVDRLSRSIHNPERLLAKLLLIANFENHLVQHTQTGVSVAVPTTPPRPGRPSPSTAKGGSKGPAPATTRAKTKPLPAVLGVAERSSAVLRKLIFENEETEKKIHFLQVLEMEKANTYMQEVTEKRREMLEESLAPSSGRKPTKKGATKLLDWEEKYPLRGQAAAESHSTSTTSATSPAASSGPSSANVSGLHVSTDVLLEQKRIAVFGEVLKRNEREKQNARNAYLDVLTLLCRQTYGGDLTAPAASGLLVPARGEKEGSEGGTPPPAPLLSIGPFAVQSSVATLNLNDTTGGGDARQASMTATMVSRKKPSLNEKIMIALDNTVQYAREWLRHAAAATEHRITRRTMLTADHLIDNNSSTNSHSKQNNSTNKNNASTASHTLPHTHNLSFLDDDDSVEDCDDVDIYDRDQKEAFAFVMHAYFHDRSLFIHFSLQQFLQYVAAFFGIRPRPYRLFLSHFLSTNATMNSDAVAHLNAGGGGGAVHAKSKNNFFLDYEGRFRAVDKTIKGKDLTEEITARLTIHGVRRVPLQVDTDDLAFGGAAAAADATGAGLGENMYRVHIQAARQSMMTAAVSHMNANSTAAALRGGPSAAQKEETNVSFQHQAFVLHLYDATSISFFLLKNNKKIAEGGFHLSNNNSSLKNKGSVVWLPLKGRGCHNTEMKLTIELL
ncbi:hypothetical protein STCU_10755 [Strigomonas culicis]|uniref:Uncharacterized protein n=1 Tax=Strigomonas culicis TaxID=28005 RepID=S9TLI8_9TRYP|nr:hypothetical protein STCU_10755 [Strigomonas culicis]|eukprot:EPY17223.1 hypothetical protein STCU_10755 [Strigomonas culicis]